MALVLGCRAAGAALAGQHSRARRYWVLRARGWPYRRRRGVYRGMDSGGGGENGAGAGTARGWEQRRRCRAGETASPRADSGGIVRMWVIKKVEGRWGGEKTEAN